MCACSGDERVELTKWSKEPLNGMGIILSLSEWTLVSMDPAVWFKWVHLTD